MRGFLIGLLVGAALLWVVLEVLDTGEPTRSTPTPVAVTEPSLPERTIPTKKAPSPQAAEATPTLADDGWLRAGDGLILSTGGIVRTADPDAVDLHCEGVYQSVLIRAPHGMADAQPPLLKPSAEITAADLAAGVRDAPTKFRRGTIALTLGLERNRSGVVLVRAKGEATAYVVWLEEVVLGGRRSDWHARLGWREVPMVEGGGRITLGSAPVDLGISALELERIDRTFRGFPKLSASLNVKGVYAIVAPADVTKDPHARFLITDPLASAIEIGFHSGTILAKGLAVQGEVKTGTHAGLVVRGNLEGAVVQDSWSAAHVQGDLLGRLAMGFHAVAIIEGDLRGTVEFATHSTLYLRGMLAGGFAGKRAGWSTFLVERLTREEVEQLPGIAGPATIHIRESNLPPDFDGSVAGFRVTVGGPVWASLPRAQ